jgi:hypothetical protein
MPDFSERDSENESSSDEAGFIVVHRPKAPVNPPTATGSPISYISSPEPVCVTPTEPKAESQAQTPYCVFDSGSETDSDETWSII